MDLTVNLEYFHPDLFSVKELLRADPRAYLLSLLKENLSFNWGTGTSSLEKPKQACTSWLRAHFHKLLE